LPVFNWTALKPNQINGTVFSELDDERVLQDLDLDRFEELFKTKAQGPALDLLCPKSKGTQRAAPKVTLLEANRAKNLAITLRKAGRCPEEICRAIHTLDLAVLPVDFVECLMRFVPTEAELKLLRCYERERRAPEELSAEDQFMLQFSKVERLPQRMAAMAFMGNFGDSIAMLTPVRRGAGQGVQQGLRGAGDTMQGGAKQCRGLQSKAKQGDAKQCRGMQCRGVQSLTPPHIPAVSLENVLLDVKELTRGMELLRRECALHESSVLRSFLAGSESKLERLQKDARTAEVGLCKPLHACCSAKLSMHALLHSALLCFTLLCPALLCFASAPCFACS
uniref:FH2 domain-containing protein n=1 Tax=Coturnix japonica TaxID=93934 RepID=A0A8C2YFC1_COTJA